MVYYSSDEGYRVFQTQSCNAFYFASTDLFALLVEFDGWYFQYCRGGQPWLCVQPAPAPAAPPLGKLNHKVELLCFADKTIIQTDSLHFIKISLTIFLHEFWFCSDLFYLSEKPLIYSCMRVHRTSASRGQTDKHLIPHRRRSSSV